MPTYLDDQGNEVGSKPPLYLDESGEPIVPREPRLSAANFRGGTTLNRDQETKAAAGIPDVSTTLPYVLPGAISAAGLLGSGGLKALAGGTLGHLFSREGAKELAKNIAIGAGLNMALGRNPREGIGEGILFTALGAPGGGTASKVATEVAEDVPRALPKLIQPLKYAPTPTPYWSPEQLGLELIEEGPGVAKQTLENIAKAPGKLRLTAAQVKKAMTEMAKSQEERVNDILKRGGGREHVNISAEDARLAARRAKGEANLQASAALERPPVQVAPAQVPSGVNQSAREAARARVAADAPATLGEAASGKVASAPVSNVVKLPPPKSESEMFQRLSMLYRSDTKSRDAVLEAAKQVWPDNWQEMMLKIKRGNSAMGGHY